MKKQRISLINGKYLFWTLVILIGELALLCGAYAINFLDNFFGYIVLPFFGFFTVYTAYEAGVLALEAITVTREGVVVAGKDEQGTTVHFEKKELASIYLCDAKGKRIPEDQKKYEKIGLAFALKNGKTRIRQTSRITQKQLDRIRLTLEVQA